MMGTFDAIRPYADSEVSAVLARLCNDTEFLDTLTRFRLPKLAGLFGWALRPLVARRLRREVQGIDSVAKLQARIEPYVDRTIERATDGISYSGLEHLHKGRRHLYLANHRDIVMDRPSSTTRCTTPATAHRASRSATTCCSGPSSAT